MAESYKKEAKIEINAVFDDESLLKKVKDSLKEISESSDKIESNVQESLDNAKESFEDFDSAVDDSVKKLDEEKYKVGRTGEVFEELERAKESAKNANLNFGDSAEEGSDKLDTEADSADSVSESVQRAGVSLRDFNDEIGFASNNISRLDKDVYLDFDGDFDSAKGNINEILRRLHSVDNIGDVVFSPDDIEADEETGALIANDIRRATTNELERAKLSLPTIRSPLDTTSFDESYDSVGDLTSQFELLDDVVPNRNLQKLRKNIGSARVPTDELGGDIDQVSEAMRLLDTEAQATSEGMRDVSDRQVDLSNNANATYNELENVTDSLRVVNDVVDENRQRFEVQGESFEDLIRSASTLEDVYSAQSDSIDVLSDSTAEQRIEAFEQSKLYRKLKDVGADLIPVYEEIADNQSILNNVSDATREELYGQRETFEDLIRSANTLEDLYSAQSDSVSVLSDSTAEQRIEALEQSEVFKSLKEEGADLIPLYQEIADNQTILNNVSGATREELYGEAESLESLVDGGESTAEMKEKVSKANKKLGGITEETAKELGIEGDALEVLASAGMLASEATDEASDSSRSLSRTLSAVNESVDDTGESLRAAAEIGDIFEDGLGSLSINLGAFTIALRNFLTQVPLLITGLGAAAEAAAGAASAFIALAGAIGSAITFGAIARAEQLKEEYSQIEELGQGVQVIFANVRDTLLEAAEPAFNTETIELFKRAVEGTATVVNLLAQGVAELSNNDGAFDLQDAFDQLREDVLPSVVNVVDALIYSFETLGSEAVGVLGTITQALADLIVKSTDFVARIEDLGKFVSQFTDTVAALSDLGLAIGSGLLPVFTVFSEVLESLADVLNQVDDEVLGNIVTFSAFIFAVSRLSGVLSTIVTIVPNLAVGFATLTTRVNNADSAFKAFQATVVGTNSRVAHFLSQISVFSGITTLIGALGGTSERLRQIAFRSSSATARFEALALGTNVTAQQLYELAVAGDLTEDMMGALQDEADEVKDEFRELQLQLALTDEQFKSLDGDFDVDVGKLSDDIDDPSELLDIGSGSILSRFIGDTSEAESVAQQAGEAVINTFDREGGMFLSQESRDFWSEGKRLKDAAKDVSLLETAQFDYGRATSFVNDKIRNNNILSGGLTGTMKKLGSSIKQATVSTTLLSISFLTLIPRMLYTLATTRSLSESYDALKSSQIGQAISSAIASSALLTYIASAITATIANYGLATSIAAVTGGLNILLAVLGAVAVGIITNFDKIKGSVNGAVSGIMPVLGALKDILLTVFVETWNVIVSAVTSLKTILDPFITAIEGVVGIFGLLSGGAKEGGDSLSALTVVTNLLVGAIEFLSNSLQFLFSIIAVVGKALTFLIMVPVKLTIGLLRGLAELIGKVFGMAAEDLGLSSGIQELIKFVNDLRKGFDKIPETVEKFVNMAIGYINSLIEKINKVPILNIKKVEEVEVTGGGLETDREELATDSRGVRNGLSRVSSNIINMKTENNQTVNQTVNADPEDTSTVKRVVEDAIDRANRFDRGRAGGQ